MYAVHFAVRLVPLLSFLYSCRRHHVKSAKKLQLTIRAAREEGRKNKRRANENNVFLNTDPRLLLACGKPLAAAAVS